MLETSENRTLSCQQSEQYILPIIKLYISRASEQPTEAAAALPSGLAQGPTQVCTETIQHRERPSLGTATTDEATNLKHLLQKTHPNVS